MKTSVGKGKAEKVLVVGVVKVMVVVVRRGRDVPLVEVLEMMVVVLGRRSGQVPVVGVVKVMVVVVGRRREVQVYQ